jgi:pyruvate/2-oxoglutarate dehydrogenase complex dihydrolipoamide dehydrogenase (E3) component
VDLFGKPTINWTDEQKTLVVISKMYDSAYEHPECPPESVIQDDDMFDGWMIIQRREHEKNKDKNRNEKILKDKKLGNAKEVFLVANSKEEAQNIYSLNNANSRNTIKERQNIILHTGSEVSETDLPDVKRELVMQQNRQFLQSRKK